jgi:acetyl-CoA carboxylase biotin carboxyl carrier protein
MTAKKSFVDQDLIRQLSDLLNETGLTEIEIENDDARVRVARNGIPATPQTPVVPVPPPIPTAKAEERAPDPANHPGIVPSPMVGTAFRAPEPGGLPYVDVGDHVREGQTLLIVEAMKTMNQIPAPKAGKVTRIMVEDGQPVEYGEPLMIIE